MRKMPQSRCLKKTSAVLRRQRSYCSSILMDSNRRLDQGHSQGAAGWEGGNKLGAARGLGARDTTVTRCEEDGSSTGAELSVSVAEVAMIGQLLNNTTVSKKQYVLGERAGNITLVLTVAGGQDLRRVRLAKEEVDDIQKALKVTILEVVADRDESGRDTGGNTDSVLNVKVLVKLSSSILHARSAYLEETRTASTPASLPLWGFEPPSSVWRVKVVEELRSVRNLVRKVCGHIYQ